MSVNLNLSIYAVEDEGGNSYQILDTNLDSAGDITVEVKARSVTADEVKEFLDDADELEHIIAYSCTARLLDAIEMIHHHHGCLLKEKLEELGATFPSLDQIDTIELLEELKRRMVGETKPASPRCNIVPYSTHAGQIAEGPLTVVQIYEEGKKLNVEATAKMRAENHSLWTYRGSELSNDIENVYLVDMEPRDFLKPGMTVLSIKNNAYKVNAVNEDSVSVNANVSGVDYEGEASINFKHLLIPVDKDLNPFMA